MHFAAGPVQIAIDGRNPSSVRGKINILQFELTGERKSKGFAFLIDEAAADFALQALD